MARVKISEFSAKKILIPDYRGLSVGVHTTTQEIIQSFPRDNLVVKVDQGIKKRGKLGLVKVNVTPKGISNIIKSWSKLGWSNFLVEPVVEHAQGAERYLALERMRDGWQVSYSPKGGIEVESSWDSVKRTVLPPQGQALTGSPSNARAGTPKVEGLALSELIAPLIPALEAHHIIFLECNPILLRGGKLIPLDMACEIDSAGSTLLPIPDRALSESEKKIMILDATTPASLKFKLLNPGGSIWMLLSGGGASLVLADEVADQGMGEKLANYGEYSGAPTNDDVYSYTKIILSQLLASNVSGLKSIIIAGGVANFTDVAKTFNGLIHALDEQKKALVKAKVRIFVRRGGPNEIEGLKLMRDFLTTSHLLGSVHGRETPLTKVITEVKQYQNI
jgi:succinyl-CoA synthetase beta subunit